jgi:hypothetical protein
MTQRAVVDAKLANGQTISQIHSRLPVSQDQRSIVDADREDQLMVTLAVIAQQDKFRTHKRLSNATDQDVLDSMIFKTQLMPQLVELA